MDIKAITLFTGLLLALILKPFNLMSQETQIAVCEGIQVITPDLATGISDFDNYPDFQQATIYKTNDTIQVMEILYKQDGAIVRVRKIIKPVDLALLCNKLTAKQISNNKEETTYRDFRKKVIGTTMAYSLLYYGFALPVSLGINREAAAGSYLLVGAAGYFLPYFALKNTFVSPGMSKGYTFGCFLGIFHGLSFGALLTGNSGSKTALGLSVFSSVAEGYGGLSYARAHNLNRAHMRTMGSLGSWGLLYGLGVPLMVLSNNEETYAACGLAGSALGIMAGDYYAKQFQPTDGDVTVINAAAIVGTYFPPLIIASFANENTTAPAIIGSAILGSVAGIAFGFHHTAHADYTRSEGNIILLGEVAGGLVGGAAAAFTSVSGTTVGWLVGLGLLGGFYAMDQITLTSKKKTNSFGSRLSFDFNPIAFKKIINKDPFIYIPGRPMQNVDLFKAGLKF
ncbi:MAG: hypothetical protein WCO63_01130 [Bacteroidota bacterium]